jgi:transposase-like protein
VTVTGTTPDKVTTDKHASYLPALEEVFCDDLEHRTSKYLNNHLEQDHRGVKGPYRPMRGFQTLTSVARFCRAHEEVKTTFEQRNAHLFQGAPDQFLVIDRNAEMPLLIRPWWRPLVKLMNWSPK